MGVLWFVRERTDLSYGQKRCGSVEIGEGPEGERSTLNDSMGDHLNGG